MKQENQLKDGVDLTKVLDHEEMAAIEGWRSANNISSVSQAVRELIRLGLLSEISKAYGVVSAVRQTIAR